MVNRQLLQKIIVDTWLNEIKNDYINDLIFNEDTLKITFCFHLRNKLQDFFLKDNIRIITEFIVDKFRTKIDIALNESRDFFFNINENISCIYVLIELKFLPIKHYKLKQMLITENIKRCDKDLFKLHELGKIYSDVLLVGAFIDEYFYNHKCGLDRLCDISQFFEYRILNRMIELNGFNYEETGEFITNALEPHI